jgi:hypothetical protein
MFADLLLQFSALWFSFTDLSWREFRERERERVRDRGRKSGRMAGDV